MAAIYQWYINKSVVVTTTPYPIEIIEGVELTADLEALNSRDISENVLDTSWAFTTASMRVLLKTYGPDEDDVDTSWGFTDATMRVLLKTHGPDEDDLNTGWSFTTASMVFKLISTQIYPHGVDLTPGLNSFNMENAP